MATESKGEDDFLKCAVERRFLRPDDVAEIQAERAEFEEFLGRPVAVAHVLYRRQWLTHAQLAEVRSLTHRQVALCPECWARINVFTLKAGQSFPCPNCKLRLLVPADPHAELLPREEAQPIPLVGDETVAGAPDATPRSVRRFEDHRSSFAQQGIEVVEEVGSGGMGVVYRAIQQPLNRVVAVKVLHSDLRNDPVIVRRFFREARETARLQHPNLVALHHAGFSDGFYFLVLQWVQGRNLRELSTERGPMPVAEVLRLAVDVTRGLGAVHATRLVHRDVKPSNVMVREDGSACLTDFGLVRSESPDASSKLTKTGDVVGTINYMSPEQLTDPRMATPASDLYSLGATLFHLLSGDAPFGGDSWSDAAIKLSCGRIERLDPERLSLPPAVAELVSRMMAPDPKKRFPGTKALEQALLAALRQSHGGARRRGSSDTQQIPLIDSEPG
ncbi:MAG: serine/threonine protein kinase [Planctomycetes bacterium]|nr:serine/threonine protein kinase [Planctomycetota bacterium]